MAETSQKTVVVVGAGLVGAMTAVFLGRRGYKVSPPAGRAQLCGRRRAPLQPLTWTFIVHR